MKIPLLKFLDASFGRLVTAAWNSSRTCIDVPLDPKAVLFVRPGGIGDAALLVPALKAFKKKFPDCEVDVLAERRNEKVLLLWSGLRDVFCYDRFADWVLVKRRAYDVIVDTEQWHRLSALFARVVGGSCLIGFGTNDRKKLLSHSLPYDPNRYEVQSFFSLLGCWGINPDIPLEIPFLDLPQGNDARINTLLLPLVGKDFVALFVGGSRPEKSWGVERFIDLATKMNECGIPYVVLGGAVDSDPSERVANAGNGFSLAGKSSLVESAELLSRARLLVANDSGLLHLAVGLGTPCLGVFGPSNPKKWGPRGRNDLIMTSSAECSPCSTYGVLPKCSHGLTCFEGISVDGVFRHVRDCWRDSVVKILN